MTIEKEMTMSEKMHPRDEGREAYMDGVPLAACPYSGDSTEAVEWEGGWIEAQEDDVE